MEWERLFREGKKTFMPLLCVVGLWLVSKPMPVSGASMQNYCNEPPFAAAGIKPNLLLMLDNSGSMYDAAYTDPASYCVDNTYQNANSYSGYFDRNTVYLYDSANTRFVAGATLPGGVCSGSCAARTPYLSVQMTGSAPDRRVTTFAATGNFLNWLSASKLDIQKQVLTGGKWASGMLQGESRGCDGKRMIKMVADAPDITFAVRGPVHTDPGYSFQTTQGGTTTIEIYDKGYHREACLKAVSAWINNDRNALISQANACLDNKEEPRKIGTGTMPTTGAVYNQVMSDCYDRLVRNVVPIDSELNGLCTKRYQGLFGDEVNLGLVAGLDGFCAGGIFHGYRGANSSGYLGGCIGSSWTTLTGNCPDIEIVDYCSQIRTPYLTDPSSTANLPGANANVPAFILDAGVTSLGSVAGTFKGRVVVESPPTGVIQQFSNSVNFGTMIFNANGATAAECTAGGFLCAKHCSNNVAQECTASTECGAGLCLSGSDGGRILSYLNDSASVGDHASGLIADIDGLAPVAWTPYAEAFYNAIGYFANRTDLRLQTTDFDINKPPSKFACQKNHILLVSDGMSTVDTNVKMEALATLYATSATGNSGSCPVNLGSRSLDDLAWIASHRNIKTFKLTAPVSTDAPVTPSQYITTHVIFTGVSNAAPGQCDPAVLMRDTATSGGGVYAAVSDPGSLGDKFREVLRKVADGSNSGTGASIISTGDGNGAVFLQEQFYPSKSFDGGVTTASWIGEMDTLWYYIDPFIGSGAGAASTTRADSDGNKKLTLKQDQIVSFRYDPASSRTWAYLTPDDDGDGAGDGAEQGPVEMEQVKALWRAGYQLWSRDLEATPRTIYTPALSTQTEITGTGLMGFSTAYGNVTPIKNAMNIVGSDPSASNVIDYVHGRDFPGDPKFRSRKVNIPPTPAASDDELKKGKGVWKLGDIISSTPKLQSSIPLGSYHLAPPSGYSDVSYAAFVNSDDYKNRGTVYVGANDGMLHAFTFGRLDTPSFADYKAALDGEDLGKEQWAFIPKNALPYLKYLTSPSYRHLYLVDGSITLADVNIGTGGAWRTVLIGGMGLGGASGKLSSSDKNYVQLPLNNQGYSSYFALDVTDPGKPSFLWEFSDPALGYATSGAAIVRSGSKWFAVFGSGPAGPIDESACQFLGRSDRNLKVFVVDLAASGAWSLGSNYWVIDTGIPYAFSGSITGGAIDVDRRKGAGYSGFYQDDALYLGYVGNSAVDGSGTWTEGGVLRILTKESALPAGNVDTSKNWSASKVIDGIGPVTAGVTKLVDTRNHKLWIFFGSGRYFYSADDLDGQRYLIGVQDRCYTTTNTLDKNCDTAARAGADPEATGRGGTLSLADLHLIDTTLTGSEKGWYVRLDAAGATVGAERSLTDPVALTSGAVLFTTFQPNKVPCQLDTSYLWRVKYDSGDPVASALQGTVLVPLSTGSTDQSDLSALSGNRRGPAMSGKAGGLKVVSNSGLRPLRRIIHIQER